MTRWRVVCVVVSCKRTAVCPGGVGPRVIHSPVVVDCRVNRRTTLRRLGSEMGDRCTIGKNSFRCWRAVVFPFPPSNAEVVSGESEETRVVPIKKALLHWVSLFWLREPMEHCPANSALVLCSDTTNSTNGSF